MQELKPCPFCGSDAEARTTYYELETKDVPLFSYVMCVRCGCRTADFMYKNSKHTGVNSAEAAAKAWNRRIETPRTVTAE